MQFCQTAGNDEIVGELKNERKRERKLNKKERVGSDENCPGTFFIRFLYFVCPVWLVFLSYLALDLGYIGAAVNIIWI